MAVNDLIVYARTESLLYRLYPALVNYPKSEKFVLCKDIKEYILEMLRYISLCIGGYAYDRIYRSIEAERYKDPAYRIIDPMAEADKEV